MINLFSEFQASTKAEWLALVEKDLKGKPLASLDWQINEQLSIAPFAHAEDLPLPYPPIKSATATNQWEIGVKVQVSQMILANQEALKALENGATAICFELKKSPTKEDLETLLRDVQIAWISIHFIFHQKAWKRFMSYFVAYLQSKELALAQVACSFSFKGNLLEDTKGAAAWKVFAQQLSNARFLTVKACSLYKGTANVVKELAETLSIGNEYLLQLNNKKLDLESGASNIQFSITLGDSYFLNIAKIRALKLLWQHILTAWGLTTNTPTAIEVHLDAITQAKDENHNKIKATSQAMSAIIGGVKRLYIAPSDAYKNRTGTPFAQRIALNIQHLMQLESYMDRVIDPSAGSYYIEQLTDKLAEAAWKEFKDK